LSRAGVAVETVYKPNEGCPNVLALVKGGRGGLAGVAGATP
jgi:hypothetical protein